MIISFNQRKCCYVYCNADCKVRKRGRKCPEDNGFTRPYLKMFIKRQMNGVEKNVFRKKEKSKYSVENTTSGITKR